MEGRRLWQDRRKNEKEGQTFVARLGLRAGVQVLDVGCAIGDQALPAARPGARVTAVDIAPNLLAQAIERARAERLEINFRGRTQKLFLSVTANSMLMMSMFAAIYAPRPEMVVAEFFRVCQPGVLL